MPTQAHIDRDRTGALKLGAGSGWVVGRFINIKVGINYSGDAGYVRF